MAQTVDEKQAAGPSLDEIKSRLAEDASKFDQLKVHL